MEQNIIRFPNSPTQKSNDNFLKRLQSMILSRFGLTVIHRHRYQLDDEITRKLIQMSAHILDETLYLPIHSLGEMKGTLIIPQIHLLSLEDKDHLIDLLRTTAVPYFEHLHRKEDLASRERQISREFVPEKVISLTETKPLINPKKSWDWKEDTIESRPVPILIEGDDNSVIYKAALELHHLSPRLIFLNFSDIDLQHRVSYASLAELNDSTIFITDFSQTSVEERSAVFELFRNHPSHEDGPAIYIGTTVSTAQLAETLKLSESDRRLLPRFQLNLRNIPMENGLDNELRTFIQYSSSSFQI